MVSKTETPKDEETQPDEEIIAHDTAVTISPEEAREMALAARKAQLSQRRSANTGRARAVEHDPNYPWPDLNPDELTPVAMAAEIVELGETFEDHIFTLNEEILQGLPFHAPALRVQRKALYTVKAVHRDGRLVQLPFEEQINNTGGADLMDAIGLRRYQRKGIAILIDWNTMVPIYCAAFDCWARSMVPALVSRFPQHAAAVNSGFCSHLHASWTLPNQFDDAGAIQAGLLSKGVTTSRIFGMT
jgi:hypothetical protein